ncbi:MAG: MBL fold metallo-hydrolase RNA specificity domain-containing protein, partial [Smithellaceae bacterium]|nr:MBL fold metallo-hydrolase RNA specificity domain-containing protein [Smithellaceae bacterium]
NRKGPAVVISASGMADAGRIKHHLRHNLWRPGASVVFVGFQAKGTTGRRIVDGAKRVNILGEEVAVLARIFTINGFSGHAGQQQLLDWLGNFHAPHLQVFLVHGEYSGQQVLADLIVKRYGWRVHIPEYLEEIILRPGEATCAVPGAIPGEIIDWGAVLEDLHNETARLRGRKAALEGKTMTEQLQLRDRVLEAKRKLAEAIAEVQ